MFNSHPKVNAALFSPEKMVHLHLYSILFKMNHVILKINHILYIINSQTKKRKEKDLRAWAYLMVYIEGTTRYVSKEVVVQREKKKHLNQATCFSWQLQPLNAIWSVWLPYWKDHSVCNHDSLKSFQWILIKLFCSVEHEPLKSVLDPPRSSWSPSWFIGRRVTKSLIT